MPLTDSAIKNLKPGDKTHKVSDSGGMYLEITNKGGTYWRLKYRFASKEKRLVLGVYPQVSLKQARQLQESAKQLLAEGIDPNEAKKADKQKSTNA